VHPPVLDSQGAVSRSLRRSVRTQQPVGDCRCSSIRSTQTLWRCVELECLWVESITINVCMFVCVSARMGRVGVHQGGVDGLID